MKEIHNTVADAISRLKSGLIQDEKANWMTFKKNTGVTTSGM